MFELTDKKVITFLRPNILPNWTYVIILSMFFIRKVTTNFHRHDLTTMVIIILFAILLVEGLEIRGGFCYYLQHPR